MKTIASEEFRSSLADTVSEIAAMARENDITLVAAGVAFYLFNSLIPLLLFLVIGLSVIGGYGILAELMEALTGLHTGQFLDTIEVIIGEGTGRTRAALIAGGMLAWSSLTLVQAINVAFGSIYDVRGNRSPIETTLNSLVVFATVVIVIPVTSLVVVGLTAIVDVSIVRALSIPLLFLVLFGGVLPMYYQFPGRTVTLREALPGSVFVAVSWTLCAVTFRLYITTAEGVRLYGIAGGLLLLLTWLYLGGLTLLVGAILNAVLGDRIEVND